MTVSKRDYYEVLSVSRDADDQTIKTAYRKLAMQYHPDRNPGDHTAEEKFKEAAEAYSVLSDSQKRAAYDRFGHQGVPSAAGGGFDPGDFDLGDILSQFGFGDFFGGAGRGRGNRAARGEDVRYDLEIAFRRRHVRRDSRDPIAAHRSLRPLPAAKAREPGSGPVDLSRLPRTRRAIYQQGFLSVRRTCSQCRGAGKIIKNPCKECRGSGVKQVTASSR